MGSKYTVKSVFPLRALIVRNGNGSTGKKVSSDLRNDEPNFSIIAARSKSGGGYFR